MSYYELTDQLLSAGKCLTFPWSTPRNALMWEQKRYLEKQFAAQNPDKVCFVRNKEVPLALENNNFHYFSNGVLVHCFAPNVAEKRIDKIRKMLAYHGYEISRVIGPKEKEDMLQCYEIVLDITEQAQQKEEKPEALEVVAFNDVREFVRYCFAKDNVLLTASKDYTFIPERRKYVALFASGLLVVSEDYRESDSFHGSACVRDFISWNSQHTPMLERIYVPQSWLDALYREAEKYDWYLTPEDAAKKHQPKNVDALEYMHRRCEDLLKGRTCICVTVPRIRYKTMYLDASVTSPDFERYVLFADGKLVLSELKNTNLLVENLHKCFPEMKFDIEKVPDEWITYLLEKVAERQKSAHDIYIEMLKQKARKLKRLIGVPHHAALEMTARVAGWKNWKEVHSVSEVQARHLIACEQDLENRARVMGYQNSIYWQGLKYLDLFEQYDIPHEKGVAFFKAIGEIVHNTSKTDNGG